MSERIKHIHSIILLIILSGLLTIAEADDRTSHGIRIRIISNNKFVIRNESNVLTLSDSKKNNLTDTIILSWKLSYRRKKINVCLDNSDDLCSMHVISKDKNNNGKSVEVSSKNNEFLDWEYSNSGECEINYRVQAKDDCSGNEKFDVIYTVTDKY